MLRTTLLLTAAALTACQGIGSFGETWDDPGGLTPVDPSGDDTPSRPVDPDDVGPISGAVAPGGRCDCDSDCRGGEGFEPLCVQGICGALASAPSCAPGSTEGCPAGHRCWSGTGLAICYPDFVEGSCAGEADDYGSCVTDGSFDCYQSCGEACSLPGDPPSDVAPIDDDPCEGLDEQGECDGAWARYCVNDRLIEVDCASLGQECLPLGGEGSRCVDEQTPVEPDDEGGDAPVGEGCSDPVVVAELALTNQARGNNGLSPLSCDEDLTRAAYLHSLDMCDRDYFSHTSRDGRSYSERISAQGVSYGTSGENIAWGQSTADEVHRTWMNSWGHRANILGRGYSRIGIGYAPCGGQPYWTQDFTD